MIENPAPLITDAVVLGILMTILGLIFITSSSEKPFSRNLWDSPRFISYFIPALFNTFNIISERLQVYTTLLSLFITRKFSITTLSINFAALKKN
jgi:hypothetical protein